MKFSPTRNISVRKRQYHLFQNERSHFLLPRLFRKIPKPSRHDQQNDK